MRAALQLRGGWVVLVVVLALAHAASVASGQAHRRATHPTVLGTCPLPGFCYRSELSSQASSSNVSGVPSDPDLAKYKLAVQEYIDSDKFQVSLSDICGSGST